MDVALQAKPVVECGIQARAGRGLLPCAADRLIVACAGGGRLSRVCCSARRDNGSFWKRCSSVRARFPILIESSPSHRARRDCLGFRVKAEKDESGTEETPEGPTPEVANIGRPVTVKKSFLLSSPDFWLQVGIFVFAAGFVDAGFSGDWSRIGVLSKQTEEELQMASLGVVPLAILLIWSISERRKSL